mgnify:FL=1
MSLIYPKNNRTKQIFTNGIENANGTLIDYGSGSPEGVVTAIVGSNYTDTTTGNTFDKKSGVGNTGWIQRESKLTKVATKTANYTTAGNELIPVDTNGGAFNITLPAITIDEMKIDIVDIAGVCSSDRINIIPNGANSINNGGLGVQEYLNIDYGYVELIADLPNLNWILKTSRTRIPTYTVGSTYLVDDIVDYNGIIVKCLLTHQATSMDNECQGWTSLTKSTAKYILNNVLNAVNGNIVYNNNGTWTKAIATSTNTCGEWIVIASNASSALIVNTGEVTLTTAQWDVVAGTTGGLTAGECYLLSQTIAGTIQQADYTIGIRQVVIRAINSTQAQVLMDAPTGASLPFSANLDSLSDVVITTPTNSQVLQYNGTNWVNTTIAGLTTYNRQHKTATYTALPTDYYISCNGTFTINLYALASFDNGSRGLIVKNVGTGTITIDGNGAETIDGNATITLTAGSSAILIPQGDGSQWTAN